MEAGGGRGGVARDVYGVAVAADADAKGAGTMAIDQAATETLRKALRERRLSEGKPVPPRATVAKAPQGGAPARARIGEALDLVRENGKAHYACQQCGRPICGAHEDPKSGALAREVKMETLSPWNRYGLVDEIVVREFCCPGCAHLIAVEVRKKGDPVLYDTELW